VDARRGKKHRGGAEALEGGDNELAASNAGLLLAHNRNGFYGGRAGGGDAATPRETATDPPAWPEPANGAPPGMMEAAVRAFRRRRHWADGRSLVAGRGERRRGDRDPQRGWLSIWA